MINFDVNLSEKLASSATSQRRNISGQNCLKKVEYQNCKITITIGQKCD